MEQRVAQKMMANAKKRAKERGSNTRYIVFFVLALFSLMFNAIATTTDKWVDIDYTQGNRTREDPIPTGLFRYCELGQCRTQKSLGWLNACSSFYIMVCILNGVAIFVTFGNFVCGARENKIPILAQILAAMFAFVALVVYMVYMVGEETLAWSFGLAVAGLVFMAADILCGIYVK